VLVRPLLLLLPPLLLLCASRCLQRCCITPCNHS
jgi:hypothetical protein